MRIEQWSIVEIGCDPSVAPELQSAGLRGRVFGHPIIADGDWVRTTPIVNVVGDQVFTQSGSEYELGDIDAEYAAAYPEARARLLAVKQKSPLNV